MAGEGSRKNQANGRLIKSKCMIYMNENLKLVVLGLGGIFFLIVLFCFVLFFPLHPSWVVLELRDSLATAT